MVKIEKGLTPRKEVGGKRGIGNLSWSHLRRYALCSILSFVLGVCYANVFSTSSSSNQQEPIVDISRPLPPRAGVRGSFSDAPNDVVLNSNLPNHIEIQAMEAHVKALNDAMKPGRGYQPTKERYNAMLPEAKGSFRAFGGSTIVARPMFQRHLV